MLIDSRASHNFISKEVIEKLEIHVVKIQSFGVRVGDGYRVRSEVECCGVCIELQGVSIIHNFFLFDISSLYVVIGITWLETLQETIVDWKTQVMKFKMGGNKVGCFVVFLS